MKTNGYMLRQAMKHHELRRDSFAQAFNGSLKAFPDETKDAPRVVVDNFLAAERAIAQLQSAQAKYNLAVTVNVQGDSMTLSEAIKRIGGEARAEKMWRSVCQPKQERYSYNDNDERDATKVRAVPTIDAKTALAFAQASSKRSNAFRAAIAVGNGQEVDLDLDSRLFEQLSVGEQSLRVLLKNEDANPVKVERPWNITS